uniref:G_PROTEIN_RECEP_F1_2 domain-containing protein n=1 Tax=Rhabditophanes sp. KR3021 TaxID=114890 RepID=A0AC35U6B3_9BILA
MNYLVYILVVVGNFWVIFSVIRSWRPRNSIGYLNPSTRLRTYITVLAIVDLAVICSLILKGTYLVFPTLQTDNLNCRGIYLLDNIIRLASLTCLLCISVERLITIKKPFSSKIRRLCIRFLPIGAFIVSALLLIIIVFDSLSVNATGDKLNCIQNTDDRSTIHNAASLIIPITFIMLITFVSFNYSQIVRHVKKKFWQRKLRLCGSTNNSRSKVPLVSEPKYMKDMTSAIVRVAFFHIICWLPFCFIQLVPIKVWNDLYFFVFFANWLTYVNSAGNWIFYAAMNRQLRSLIRATTERRKRSTLSQISSPLALQQSLKRQVAHSLKFFNTLHHKASGAGLEQTCVINPYAVATKLFKKYLLPQLIFYVPVVICTSLQLSSHLHRQPK